MMDIMLREFGRYVRDTRRTDLFAQAIAATVRPGDVVVDLGAGFGLLAMLCVRHGAARVYAIEQGPHVELGRAIVRDNGMAERIVWVAGNSARAELPERADVIVSETLGQWALEEYTVEYLRDAALRLAKPQARIIPQSLALAVAPASAPHLQESWAQTYGPQWADVHGFDLTRLRQAVFVNEVAPYVPVQASEVELLAAPVEVARFELGISAGSRFTAEVAATCTRAGLCDGWLGMFSATLAPGVVLSTAPGEPATHWGNVLFPLCPARAAALGEMLSARIGFLGPGGWLYDRL
jgi:protein arginine N-methyltransferase 1